MGIHKPGIRYIIRHGVPESLSSWLRELGGQFVMEILHRHTFSMLNEIQTMYGLEFETTFKINRLSTTYSEIVF